MLGDKGAEMGDTPDVDVAVQQLSDHVKGALDRHVQHGLQCRAAIAEGHYSFTSFLSDWSRFATRVVEDSVASVNLTAGLMRSMSPARPDATKAEAPDAGAGAAHD